MSADLSTDRMVLRAFRTSDAECLVELDSDSQVMHFITGGRATPREEIERDVLPAFMKRTPYGYWAAEVSGEFAGWFHLRPGSGAPSDEPELGYRLARRFWGRGLATEGSRALLTVAFEQFGARRVTAETMVVNTASRRVMEKCGMRVDHFFHGDWPDRIPGDEHGDVQYAITAEQWRDGQSDRVTSEHPGGLAP